MTTGFEPARVRPNQYRSVCVGAAHVATTAVQMLTSTRPHPLDGALRTLQDAWVSPSTQRADFEGDLLDVSRRLLAAFTSLRDDLHQVAAHEPLTVDLDNPAEAWKAWADQGRAPAY